MKRDTHHNTGILLAASKAIPHQVVWSARPFLWLPGVHRSPSFVVLLSPRNSIHSHLWTPIFGLYYSLWHMVLHLLNLY